MAVKTNKIAKIYSIVFFVLMFLINNLKLFPKITQRHIEGKHMSAPVVVTKIIPTKIFSSVGKKPEATAIAIDQAFGLIS